jgi:hypothetical protein
MPIPTGLIPLPMDWPSRTEDMIEVLALKWVQLNGRRCAPGERQWTLPSEHVATLRDLELIAVIPESIPSHLLDHAAMLMYFGSEILIKVHGATR